MITQQLEEELANSFIDEFKEELMDLRSERIYKATHSDNMSEENSKKLEELMDQYVVIMKEISEELGESSRILELESLWHHLRVIEYEEVYKTAFMDAMKLMSYIDKKTPLKLFHQEENN